MTELPDWSYGACLIGPPGSGKTLLNSSLTLIAEENYIDEFEENMLKQK